MAKSILFRKMFEMFQIYIYIVIGVFGCCFILFYFIFRLLEFIEIYVKKKILLTKLICIMILADFIQVS